MRLVRLLVVLSTLGVGALAGLPARAQTQLALTPRVSSIPLVLVGGTVVDVTDWGHSAKDLPDAVVIVRDGRITDVGSRMAVSIPKGARVIDCTGKYLIPGLVDGFAGMNSQGQASAFLYMGVTTVVAVSDSRRGWVDLAASPSPHLYLMDSIGTTDNWNLLGSHLGGRSMVRGGQSPGGAPEWAAKLRENGHPSELSPEETGRQIIDAARMGTRVLWLGHNLTAVNTQWIVTRAHQMGLVTYGEFVATPYKVGIEAGVDALPQMGRYELGVIPSELQKPLVDDPEGAAVVTAYDYSERLPPTDLHLRTYAKLIASHHAALLPAFSRYYLNLPAHRNLWKEPAAVLLDPEHMSNPSNRVTGELDYSVGSWVHRLGPMTLRWMEDGQRKKADQSALRLWNINEAIFASYPRYLAGSGAPVDGSMPGISLHTELELLVRLGLSPREALAAATNNFALQYDWNELGLIAPGRRADILAVDADPTQNIWNARRISLLLMDGNVVDREGLLQKR